MLSAMHDRHGCVLSNNYHQRDAGFLLSRQGMARPWAGRSRHR